MKVITSLSNKYVREARDLLKKPRLRRECRLFVAEGERLCGEIPAERIERIFLTEDYAGRLPQGFSQIESAGRVYRLSRMLMEQISDTKTSQGILCVVRMKEAEKLRGDFFLLLETIQDPGNLGTMFRTAEAAGVTGIVMDQGCADVYSPKVVRATMGALYRMPFRIVEDLPAAVEQLKARGVRVYAAHLKAERSCYSYSFRTPTAFLIGNEGSGLSTALAERATDYLRIPMEGDAESLNAAAAAAVLLYETLRQRQAGK